MRTRAVGQQVWLAVLLSGVSGIALAAEAHPPTQSAAVHELSGPANQGLDARNWRLDPAVFTEITPFTAPDIAITLPPEQLDEQPTGASSQPAPAQDPASP